MSEQDRKLELVEKARESKREAEAEHDEFLATISEEDGAEVLETKVTLTGEYTVDVRAKMDGELMDTLGHIDARIERLDSGEGRAYEVSEAADDASQLLADLVVDNDYSKALFYDVYRQEGLEALGVLIERVFDALRAEKERRHGTADGFRPTER